MSPPNCPSYIPILIQMHVILAFAILGVASILLSGASNYLTHSAITATLLGLTLIDKAVDVLNSGLVAVHDVIDHVLLNIYNKLDFVITLRSKYSMWLLRYFLRYLDRMVSE